MARSIASFPLGVMVLGLLACTPAATTPPSDPQPASTPAADPPAPAKIDFARERDAILEDYLRRYPARAVELGLHEHDGKLRDTSARGLAQEQAALDDALTRLAAIDRSTLDPLERVELGTLEIGLRGERFELKTRRAPWRNPMFYLADLNLAPYIARDYAPLEQRAKAIIAVANATPQHVTNAASNLEPRLPRTFIETALLQVRGTIEFCETDVPTAMAGLPEPTKGELDAALATMVAALRQFEAALVEREKIATDDFAMGADAFLAMLRETQGIDVDLATLREIGQRDLERNFKAMQQAAMEISPRVNTGAVVRRVQAKRPKASQVLAVATEQSERTRAFLLERGLVTIPREDAVIVKESPPFMRWNAAFLEGAGAYSDGSLPSFYYISPPDPSWPQRQQIEYIPGHADLLFITIHEVWPGHFLHDLHIRQQRSATLKSFWGYAMGEGWAHYVEEMMWDEGYSDDPADHVGQLQNALLRNVRYMSALGLHTSGMTVDESFELFRLQAFQDEANARQQAVRGTFDPMYLSYTLGKLIIVKLRNDVRAAAEARGEAFDLRAFHDQLLSYGSAPLPVIREAMLGPDAGPLL